MANVDALLSLRGLGSAAFCGPPATSSSSWARPTAAKPSSDRPLIVGADASNPWRAAAHWTKTNPIAARFARPDLLLHLLNRTHHTILRQ